MPKIKEYVYLAHSFNLLVHYFFFNNLPILANGAFI